MGCFILRMEKKLIAYPAAKAGQSYTVPQEVEMIFPNAFTGCKNLETILVEEGNPFYESVEGALVDKRAGELIAYPAGNKRIRYTVPENVTTVAEGVFMAAVWKILYADQLNMYISVSFGM